MKTKIIPAINAQSFEEIKEKINILKDLAENFHLDVASLDFTGHQTWQNPNDLDKLILSSREDSYGFATEDNVSFGSSSEVTTQPGLGFRQSSHQNERGETNTTDYARRSCEHFAGTSGEKQIDEEVYNILPKLIFDLHLMIPLKPQEILKWAKENVKRLILHLEASLNPDGLLRMAKKTKKEIFLAWAPNIEFDFLEKYLNYIQGVLVLGVNPGKAGQNFLEETYQRIAFVKTKLKKNQKLMIDGGVNKGNFEKILSYQPDFIVIASAIYNSPQPQKNYLDFKKIIST